MANRSLVLAVAALGLLGCVTGCTRAIAGVGIPGSRPAAGVMSAATELGDFDTIQPCSMVDVEGLPADLQAEPEAADSFDSCSLQVDSAGATIQLDVGELVYDTDDTGETGPEALPSGLRLYTGTVQQGSCSAYLKFAEGIEMTSIAYANDGDGTADLCTTAATVARNVSGVLARGPVPHRSFPRNSFAGMDPCRLLDKGTLGPLGLDADQYQSYPAHHECEWTGYDQNDNSLTTYVSFIVGPPPVAQAGVSNAVQISGRSSITISTTEDTAAECWIDTAGQAFGGSQQNLVEIAEVYVSYDNQSTDSACQAGTSLATVIWPELPSTS
jgi:hypothetical protein